MPDTWILDTMPPHAGTYDITLSITGARGNNQRHTAAAGSLLHFCTLDCCLSGAAGWQSSPKRNPALQSRPDSPTQTHQQDAGLLHEIPQRLGAIQIDPGCDTSLAHSPNFQRASARADACAWARTDRELGLAEADHDG